MAYATAIARRDEMSTRTTRPSRRAWALVAPATAAILLAAAGTALAAPTCSEFGWETHGDHVIGDYLTGEDVGWPPAGHELGETLAAQGGAATPGGPAHFDMEGVPPGASFCVDSNAPSVPRP